MAEWLLSSVIADLLAEADRLDRMALAAPADHAAAYRATAARHRARVAASEEARHQAAAAVPMTRQPPMCAVPPAAPPPPPPPPPPPTLEQIRAAREYDVAVRAAAEERDVAATIAAIVAAGRTPPPLQTDEERDVAATVAAIMAAAQLASTPAKAPSADPGADLSPAVLAVLAGATVPPDCLAPPAPQNAQIGTVEETVATIMAAGKAAGFHPRRTGAQTED